MSDKLGPLVIKELSIVVATKNNDPTILNPDFLKLKNIIPGDWQPKVKPTCVDIFSQVVHPDGVTITSEQEKISFIDTRFDLDDSRLGDIVGKFLERVPLLHCLAIGINPAGHVKFPDKQRLREFALSNLVNNRKWPDKLKGIGVFYKFDISQQTTFSLRVEEGSLKESNNKIPVLIFSGNFHRNIKQEYQLTTKSALEIIRKCSDDIKIFKHYVENFYL